MNDESDEPARQRLTRAEAKSRTRALLLEAAAKTFARKGYAGASVEEIAEGAGFSIGALYSNFGGKEELFLELAATYNSSLISRAAEVLHEHEAGDARAADLGRLLADSADRDVDVALLRSEFWLYAMRNPAVMETLAARLREPRSALEGLVGPTLEQLGAPPEASAKAVATVVAALFDGLVRQRQIDPAQVPDELFGLALRWLFTGIGAA